MPITIVFFQELAGYWETRRVNFDQPNSNSMHMVLLLMSHNLNQHIFEPTHNLGHTLDLVIVSRSPSLLDDIDISPPAHSDHSSIHFTITTKTSPKVYHKIESSFAKFDISSFQKHLQESELYNITLQPTTPVTAESLFAL